MKGARRSEESPEAGRRRMVDRSTPVTLADPDGVIDIVGTGDDRSHSINGVHARRALYWIVGAWRLRVARHRQPGRFVRVRHRRRARGRRVWSSTWVLRAWLTASTLRESGSRFAPCSDGAYPGNMPTPPRQGGAYPPSSTSSAPSPTRPRWCARSRRGRPGHGRAHGAGVGGQRVRTARRWSTATTGSTSSTITATVHRARTAKRRGAAPTTWTRRPSVLVSRTLDDRHGGDGFLQRRGNQPGVRWAASWPRPTSWCSTSRRQDCWPAVWSTTWSPASSVGVTRRGRAAAAFDALVRASNEVKTSGVTSSGG